MAKKRSIILPLIVLIIIVAGAVFLFKDEIGIEIPGFALTPPVGGQLDSVDNFKDVNYTCDVDGGVGDICRVQGIIENMDISLGEPSVVLRTNAESYEDFGDKDRDVYKNIWISFDCVPNDGDCIKTKELQTYCIEYTKYDNHIGNKVISSPFDNQIIVRRNSDALYIEVDTAHMRRLEPYDEGNCGAGVITSEPTEPYTSKGQEVKGGEEPNFKVTWGFCPEENNQFEYCNGNDAVKEENHEWSASTIEFDLNEGQTVTFKPLDVHGNLLPQDKFSIRVEKWDMKCAQSYTNKCDPQSEDVYCRAQWDECSDGYTLKTPSNADKVYCKNSFRGKRTYTYHNSGNPICWKKTGNYYSHGDCKDRILTYNSFVECDSVNSDSCSIWGKAIEPCDPGLKCYSGGLLKEGIGSCKCVSVDCEFGDRSTVSSSTCLSGDYCICTKNTITDCTEWSGKNCNSGLVYDTGKKECVNLPNDDECLPYVPYSECRGSEKWKCLSNGIEDEEGNYRWYLAKVDDCISPRVCQGGECVCISECNYEGEKECDGNDLNICHYGECFTYSETITKNNCCIVSTDCNDYDIATEDTCVNNECQFINIAGWCNNDNTCKAKHIDLTCNLANNECVWPTTGNDYCSSGDVGKYHCDSNSLEICSEKGVVHNAVQYKWDFVDAKTDCCIVNSDCDSNEECSSYECEAVSNYCDGTTWMCSDDENCVANRCVVKTDYPYCSESQFINEYRQCKEGTTKLEICKSLGDNIYKFDVDEDCNVLGLVCRATETGTDACVASNQYFNILCKSEYGVKQKIDNVEFALTELIPNRGGKTITVWIEENQGATIYELTLGSDGSVLYNFDYERLTSGDLTIKATTKEISGQIYNAERTISVLAALDARIVCDTDVWINRDIKCTIFIEDGETHNNLYDNADITFSVTRGGSPVSWVGGTKTNERIFSVGDIGDITVELVAKMSGYLEDSDSSILSPQSLTTDYQFSIDNTEYERIPPEGIKTGMHTFKINLEQSGQPLDILRIDATLTGAAYEETLVFRKDFTGAWVATSNLVESGRSYSINGRIYPADTSINSIPIAAHFKVLEEPTPDYLIYIIIGASILIAIILIVIVVALVRKRR